MNTPYIKGNKYIFGIVLYPELYNVCEPDAILYLQYKKNSCWVSFIQDNLKMFAHLTAFNDYILDC